MSSTDLQRLFYRTANSLVSPLEDFLSDGSRPVRRGRQRWDLERQVRLVAGSLVLAGIVGSVFVPELKYLSGFVGAGLTFAALSNTCAMGMALSKLPYNRAANCDVDRVVRDLTANSAGR